MSLTTQSGTKLGQSVVTDLNANIPISGEKARFISPEAAILFDKSVVAEPLGAPEVCSVHVKNLDYQYRWVNKLAQNGQWYRMRRSQGYINATNEDVEVLSGDAVCAEGEVTAGDLILMKIQKDRHARNIKANMIKALELTGMRGVMLENASSDVNSDAQPKRVSVAQEPFTRGGKATPYIPENPDAIIENSIQSGRVNAARETVDNLRKQK